MSAAAVFGGLSSPIELGLEGTRHGLAVRTGAEELFDPSLGAVEPLLRYPRKPDALLEKRERRFEGEIPTLELVDDLGEAADGIFERNAVTRYRRRTS